MAKYLELANGKFITIDSKLLIASNETYYLKTADGYYPTTSAEEKLLFYRGENNGWQIIN